MTDRFAAACATGDIEALLAVLDPDVIGEFDSGGRFPGAPLGPLVGVQAVEVISVDSDGHTVRAIHAIGNPAKLAHLYA